MNGVGWIVVGAALRVSAVAVVGLGLGAILRRQGPSAGALVISTTLAILIVVSGLAACPWPRWWSIGETPTDRAEIAAASPAPPIEGAYREARARPKNPDVSAPRPDEARAGMADFFLDEFRRELARPVGSSTASRWRWPAWAGVLFLAGMIVSLARLALGFWAVRTLRVRGRAVVDRDLLALLEAIRGEMGLSLSVEIRESEKVGTPATVGWRRPVVLLPPSWTTWDDRERRAVLAHELAHILRDDYRAGLAAQVSLSLHYYHPLVHLLARRLRFHQELAADAWGARFSGGRLPYLTILANLALRQEPRPAAWPARPFLPGPGTFLRRIEMLRDPKILEYPPLPARGRAVTVAALVAAGVLVAGFRGPGGSPRALAQDRPGFKEAPAAVAQSLPALDPTTASSDVHVAIDIRPAELLKNPEIKKLADQVPADGPRALAAIASGEIEQVLVLGFDPRQEGAPAGGCFVLRSVRPYDWKASLDPSPREVQGDGFTYYRLKLAPDAICFRILDDRTMLIGTEADVKVPPIGGDRPKGRHAWDDTWRKLPPGAIRAALDAPWLARQIRGAEPPQRGRLGPFSPVTSLLGPLLDKARGYGMSLGVADGLTVEGLAGCGEDEGAGRVADTLRAYLTLARNAIPDLRQLAEGGPRDAARTMVDLVDTLDAMLETARIEQDKLLVKLHARGDASTIATATRMLLPAIGASREAARRVRCVNSLKQIGLAMHNYHQVNGRFPAAVLYGPDGKTPHSWRVALLPYLEANDVYSQYRFDEPWDGPNNRKLIPRMPTVFACPNHDEAQTGHFSSYYVLTGPDTLFPDRKEGVQLQEIIDGTSNTIMVIEARKEVPWTRPEDIAFDKDKPFPATGVLHPGGFNAAFADGAVRFLSKSIDPTVLRGLITRAGGEIISTDSR